MLVCQAPGEDTWDFTREWAPITTAVATLSELQQITIVDEVRKLLSAEYALVKVSEPIVTQNTKGRPKGAPNKPAKSTKRDPSGFEIAAKELKIPLASGSQTGQKKKDQQPQKKRGAPAKPHLPSKVAKKQSDDHVQHKHCAVCDEVGHSANACPDSAPGPLETQGPPPLCSSSSVAPADRDLGLPSKADSGQDSEIEGPAHESPTHAQEPQIKEDPDGPEEEVLEELGTAADEGLETKESVKATPPCSPPPPRQLSPQPEEPSPPQEVCIHLHDFLFICSYYSIPHWV